MILRKILILIAILTISYSKIFSQAIIPYHVQDTSALKSYFGIANEIYVYSDTSIYILCPSCVVNGYTVLQGIASRKWLKITSANSIDSSVVHIHGTENIIGNKTFTAVDTFRNNIRMENSSNLYFNGLRWFYSNNPYAFTSLGLQAGAYNTFTGAYPYGFGNTDIGVASNQFNINGYAITSIGANSLSNYSGFRYFDTSTNKTVGADMTFGGYNAGAGIISGGGSVGLGNEAGYGTHTLLNSVLIGASVYWHNPTPLNDSSQDDVIIGALGGNNGRLDSTIMIGAFSGNESTITNGGGLIIIGNNSGTHIGLHTLHKATIIGHHVLLGVDSIVAIGSLGQNIIIGNNATAGDNAGVTRALYSTNNGNKLQINGGATLTTTPPLSDSSISMVNTAWLKSKRYASIDSNNIFVGTNTFQSILTKIGKASSKSYVDIIGSGGDSPNWNTTYVKSSAGDSIDYGLYTPKITMSFGQGFVPNSGNGFLLETFGQNQKAYVDGSNLGYNMGTVKIGGDGSGSAAGAALDIFNYPNHRALPPLRFNYTNSDVLKDTLVSGAVEVYKDSIYFTGQNLIRKRLAFTTDIGTGFSGSLSGDVTGTQSATSVNKINGISLASLSTGLLKNTTGTGQPSIAVGGIDYMRPGVDSLSVILLKKDGNKIDTSLLPSINLYADGKSLLFRNDSILFRPANVAYDNTHEIMDDSTTGILSIGAISQSKITGLSTTLATYAPLLDPHFITDGLTSPNWFSVGTASNPNKLTIDSSGHLKSADKLEGIGFVINGNGFINSPGNNQFFDIMSRSYSGTSNNTGIHMFNGSTMSNSAGTTTAVQFIPTIAQTGTATMIDWLFNDVETSLGSGGHKFIDFQISNAEKAYIQSDGSAMFSGLRLGYVAKSGAYTLTSADNIVEITATGQTMTLPTAVGITGKQYTIVLTASGTGTVATTSSQTINGATTYSLSAQYKRITVVSNGANWLITDSN